MDLKRLYYRKALLFIIFICLALLAMRFSVLLPALIMPLSNLFDDKKETSFFIKVMNQNLKHVMTKIGINPQKVDIVIKGEFRVLRNSHTRVLINEYILSKLTSYKLQELLLENGIILLIGMSTVGLLTSYIIGLLYGKALLKSLFVALLLSVYVVRKYSITHLGNALNKKWVEACCYVFLVMLLLNKLRFIRLILFVSGMLFISFCYKKHRLRKRNEKEEKELFNGLINSLGTNPFAFSKRILRAISQKGLVTASLFVENPSSYEILKNISMRFSNPDFGETLKAISISVSLIGYNPKWASYVIKIRKSLENAKTKVKHQLAKVQLMSSLMFLITGVSLSILSTNPIFSLNSLVSSIVPILYFDSCFLAFSFIYSSELTFSTLFFCTIFSEIVLLFLK